MAESSGDGHMLCDVHRTIVYANAAICGITGYSQRELTGKKLSILCPSHERARQTKISTDAIRKIGVWSAELFLQRKNKGLRRCELRIVLHRFPESSEQLLMVMVKPITESLPGVRVAGAGVLQWEQVVESLDDAIVIVDRVGRVTACNEGFVRMLERSRDEVLGSRLPYPWLAASSVESYKQAFKSARRGGKVLNTIIAWRGNDLRQLVTSMTITRLRQQGRQPARYIVALRDVSNVEYVDQLRRADDRLQLLMTELQRRTATLHALIEIQRFVLEGKPIERVFGKIVSAMKELVTHDLGGIYLIQADGKTLCPESLSKKNKSSRCMEGFCFTVGQGLLGAAAQSGERVVVNDAHMDPRSVYPLGKKPGTEHVIVIPLRVKEFVFGILAVVRNSGNRFTEDDADVVQSFANSALVALQNVGLPLSYAGMQEPGHARDVIRAAGLRIITGPGLNVMSSIPRKL